MEASSEFISTNEINIIEVVKDTVNSLCNSLFDSINNTVFPLLDEIVFIDKNIVSSSSMEKLFGTSSSTGILILANCLLFAFVLYYSIRLLISHFSGNTIDSPYKFFIKTIIITIIMNSSLSICSFLVDSSYQISLFFCELGDELFGKEISFISFTNELKRNLGNNSDIFSLDGILASTLYVSSFGLVINFSLRYILIKILIILSPFAILCLTNQSTDPFFKSWFKSFLALLILQIIVAIILLISFTLSKETSNELPNKILLVGGISALLKSNQFVKELIGGLGINSNLQTGISNLKSMFAK
jgi:hypothetical protein